MKKILIILLLVSGYAFCQEKQPKVNRNEIKSNVFGTVMGGAELSYEYILNKKYAIGSSIIIGYDFEGLIPAFAFRPFFKHYFFNKYGEGFFVKLVGDLSYHSKYTTVFVGPGAFLGYKIRMKDLIIELDVGLDTVIQDYKILIRPNPASFIGISIGVAF